MKTTRDFATLAMFCALAATLSPGCAVGDDRELTDANLLQDHAAELEALGVFDVVPEGEIEVLLDQAGSRVGFVAEAGPHVDVGFGPELAVLERRGMSLGVSCSSSTEHVVLDSPTELRAWLGETDASEDCVRAVRVARLVSGIDAAHAEGCAIELVDGEERLGCASDPNTEGEVEFRILDVGCGCEGDGWGLCPAECWSCGDNFAPVDPFCDDPWDDPWGDGGGGGGDGGGGDLDPVVCSAFDEQVEGSGWHFYTASGAKDYAKSDAEDNCEAKGTKLNGWCSPNPTSTVAYDWWYDGVHDNRWEANARTQCKYYLTW